MTMYQRVLSLTFRLGLLFAGGALLTGSVTAQPNEIPRRFEAANVAYEDGRYAQAAKTYRAILDSGFASAALYYNLGNAYVRTKRLGQAVRYYEKARRFGSRDPRVLHNLEQARRRAGVYPGTLPPRGLPGIVRGWSPLAIFLAGWLLLSSGLVVAVVWIRPDSWSVIRHPLVWGPVLGGVLLIGLGLGTSAVQATQQRAVVVAGQAVVRGAPAATAPSDTTLTEATLVEVRDGNARWRRVRLASGRTGWVPARALGDI